jgi:hypothetical protein
LGPPENWGPVQVNRLHAHQDKPDEFVSVVKKLYQFYEFVSVVKKLYQFYASSAPASTKQKSKAASRSSTTDVLMENVDNDLEAFLYSQNQPGMIESNKLEKYIAEPLLQIAGQFDILA